MLFLPSEYYILAGISSIGISVGYFIQLRNHIMNTNKKLRREALTHARHVFSSRDKITETDLEVICRKLRKRRHLIDDVKNGATSLYLAGMFLFLAGLSASDKWASLLSLTFAGFLLALVFTFTARIFYEK